MLDDLRKNQKGIIWLIAIVFIAGMAVMGIVEIFQPKPYVGKIYGKKILYGEYDRMYRDEMTGYRMQDPDATFDEQTMQQINDQTWNRLVAKTVMDRQLKRYRIKVKNNDVIEKFRNDPPDVVLQNPEFQTNGVFDKQKFNDVVANYPDFAYQLELYIRQLLPYELLERKIKDQVVVTEDSVRADWLSKNEKSSGRALYFEWSRVPEQEVTEAEIADYYKKNSDKYRKEATRKYFYVQLPIAPSHEDSVRAREDIYYVYNLVKQGGDFATLAEQYSQDPGSAANGGSLGFFGRGRMVPEFENTAFSMEIGEISEPFTSQFGWHFMIVTDKRENDNGEPEVEASHILIKVETSDATRFAIRNNAEQLYDIASKVGLGKAADEMGLDMRETAEFFAETEYVPGLGRYPHLVKAAFSNKIGHLVEPLRQQDGSYIVAELSHRQAAHIQPLHEVSEVIKREIDKEKRLAIARKQAEEMMATFDPMDWFAQTDSLGFRVIDFNDILITRSIPSIGLQRHLNRAIFDTPVDQWTDLITTDNGLVKVFVTVRDTPSEDTFQRDLNRLTLEYRTTKENNHYNEWYQKVLNEANVEDLRYLYY